MTPPHARFTNDDHDPRAKRTAPRGPRLSRWARAVSVTACLAWAGVASLAHAVEPSEFVRWELERVALMDLRLQTRPTAVDYELAGWALETAADLAPDDPELWRRIIAAQFNAGMVDRIRPSTERLLRADPRDTVAALRLINMSIAEQQTAEARLELYDRFLGPRGERLDASVRARLAVDAALLVRELGDDEGYKDRIRAAVELDPSNKDAAALAVDAFGAVQDPVVRFQWLTRLLYADPLDPLSLRRIAELLASEGADAEAYRFYEVMSSIERQTRVPPDAPRELFRYQFVWRGPGPAEVVRQLNAELEGIRRQAGVEFQRNRDSQLSIADQGRQFDPTGVRLPLNYERVRILAAEAAEQLQTTRRSLQDYMRSTEAAVVSLNGRLADATTDEQRAAIVSRQNDLKLDAQMLRAWTGAALLESESSIQELEQTLPGQYRPQILELRAWTELHRGNTRRAFDLTAGQRPEDLSLGLRVLRAAALETERRFQEAAVQFRDAARSTNEPFMRLYLGARAKRAQPGIDLDGPAREQLGELASQIPDWLDKLPDDPSRFVTMSVEPLKTVIEPGEPSLIRITVRNIAPIAMQVGPNQPINSNFVVIPAVDARRAGFVGLPRPEVVELDRRLRLARGETIEAVISADLGITGWLFAMHTDTRIDLRWRVVQGFVVDTRGQLVTGPGALATETDRVVRSITLVPSATDPRPLPERVRESTDDEIVPLALFTRSLLLREQPFTDDTGTETEILGAWSDRYRAATTDTVRAAIALALPHGTLAPLMAPLDDLIRADLTERVTGEGVTPAFAAAVAMTRPGRAGSELLSVLRTSADRRIASIAAIQDARLQAGITTFATATDSWEGLVGASLRSVEPGR